MADVTKEQKTTFADIKAEYKKITWPTKVELRKQTATVIFACLLISVLIFAMDLTYNFGIRTLANALLNRPMYSESIDEADTISLEDMGISLEDLIIESEEADLALEEAADVNDEQAIDAGDEQTDLADDNSQEDLGDN